MVHFELVFFFFKKNLNSSLPSPKHISLNRRIPILIPLITDIVATRNDKVKMVTFKRKRLFYVNVPPVGYTYFGVMTSAFLEN